MVTGVVLAGGQSRRLESVTCGQPKAWLQFGGQPLIFRILERLREAFPELLVVAQHPEALVGELGVKVTGDLQPGCGPLGGIYTALRTVSSPYIFCCACDMPFLSPTVIKYMRDTANELDVVIPRFAGRTHPLHAIYSQRCTGEIERLLQRQEYRITNFFPQVRVGYVEEAEILRLNPQGRCLFNVNTKEDLELALKWEYHFNRDTGEG